MQIVEMAAGGYFGEVALLRQTTRKSTVTAKTELTCLLLEKEAFDKCLAPVKATLLRGMNEYDLK